MTLRKNYYVGDAFPHTPLKTRQPMVDARIIVLSRIAMSCHAIRATSLSHTSLTHRTEKAAAHRRVDAGVGAAVVRAVPGTLAR